MRHERLFVVSVLGLFVNLVGIFAFQHGHGHSHGGKLDIANLLAIQITMLILQTLDTIGNCQRPVFSLAISQHMHKITNLCKFELNRLSKLRDNNEIKNTLVTQTKLLSDA